MSPPPAEALPPTQSVIPKVFGIIHIVYACIGMIGAIFAVGAFFVMKAVMQNLPEGSEGMEGFLNAYDKMAIYTYLDAGIKLLFGIMLLVAGIGLLKRKLWAQKLSISWAVLRMILAVVMVVLTYSANLALQEELAEISNNQASQNELQSILQGAGTILNILFISVYPVLTIIFLSKKSAKDMLK